MRKILIPVIMLAVTACSTHRKHVITADEYSASVSRVASADSLRLIASAIIDSPVITVIKTVAGDDSGKIQYSVKARSIRIVAQADAKAYYDSLSADSAVRQTVSECGAGQPHFRSSGRCWRIVAAVLFIIIILLVVRRKISGFLRNFVA